MSLPSITVGRIARGGRAAFECANGLAGSTGEKRVRLSDGAGLYLVVDPSGSARWLFLFRWRGKLKELGFGGLSKVPLKAAREKAEKARQQLGKGVNPIDAKRAEAAIPTFGEVADTVLEAKAPAFKNVKHEANWRRAIGAPRPVRLQTGGRWVDGAPRPSFTDSLRCKRVDQVTSDDVLAVLKPIWNRQHETARRLRGQIAEVLDAAKAAGHRAGENPAAWGGNLKHRLSAQRKLTKGHRPSLPYDELPVFMTALRAREAMAARMLEFAVLTCARSTEVRGMTWGEIDLDRRLWTCPPERMKGGVEHIVPLSTEALAVVAAVAIGSSRRPSDYVFRSARMGRSLSEAAMMTLLRRMGHDSITQHGFRSTFRTWAGDATNFPRVLAEHALAHAVGNEVEQAYNRGTAIERRREMMQAWARFCEGGAEIIDLQARRDREGRAVVVAPSFCFQSDFQDFA